MLKGIRSYNGVFNCPAIYGKDAVELRELLKCLLKYSMFLKTHIIWLIECKGLMELLLCSI